MKKYVINGCWIILAFFSCVGGPVFLYALSSLMHSLSLTLLLKSLMWIAYLSIMVLPVLLLGYNYLSLQKWLRGEVRARKYLLIGMFCGLINGVVFVLFAKLSSSGGAHEGLFPFIAIIVLVLSTFIGFLTSWVHWLFLKYVIKNSLAA